MSKIVCVIALAGLLVSATSCGKKYDCVCVDSNGAESSSKVRGASKEAAALSCVAKSSSSSTNSKVCTLQ